MEMGIFTWMYLFGMVASQHPLRIGLTQSLGWLLRNILCALVVPKALRSSSCCLAFLLLVAFMKASFQRLLEIKKPTLFAWAL